MLFHFWIVVRKISLFPPQFCVWFVLAAVEGIWRSRSHCFFLENRHQTFFLKNRFIEIFFVVKMKIAMMELFRSLYHSRL